MRQAIGDLPDIQTGECTTNDSYKENSPFSFYQRTMRQYVYPPLTSPPLMYSHLLSIRDLPTNPVAVNNHKCIDMAADYKWRLEVTPRDEALGPNGQLDYDGDYVHPKVVIFPDKKRACRASWERYVCVVRGEV